MEGWGIPIVQPISRFTVSYPRPFLQSEISKLRNGLWLSPKMFRYFSL